MYKPKGGDFMKIMKKILCTVLVVVMCLTSAPLSGFVGLELPEWNWKASAADEYKEGYYTYTVTNGKATIIAVDSSISGDVVIPSTLGGYSVTTIGDSAFDYCDILTSITIPDSVTTIGAYAFAECDSLTSIFVDADNPAYSSDSRGALFDKNKTILIQYPIGNTNSSYSIPNSVTTIGDDAFCYCDILTSITIPDSVTTIGDEAFFDCYRLTSVTIGDSVTTIGDDAFCYCYSLTSVTIPDSVTTIGEGAFSGCDSLTSIFVDADNPAYSSDSRGALFDKNKTILVQYPIGNANKSYTIPDSIVTIDKNAFSGCTILTSVIIGNNVTTIGFEAFASCESLTSVTIPDSVTIIETWAFSDCHSLTSVTIGSSVKTIGSGAFCGCDSLTSVTISDSVTTIKNQAFDYSGLIVVYYDGTEEQWNNINIDKSNNSLLNATIHFLGEDDDEPDTPDGYKLKLWSDGAYSDSIAVGESIGFDVYLLENGKYLDCERPYAVSFDVQGVFEVSQIKTSTDSMYIKLRANKAGTTNMTISDNVTGAYVTLKLKANVPVEVLTMDEVEGLAKEYEGTKTHFYDYNGLYVNNFYYREKKDGSCEVAMNVYNEKAHYGAIVSYDKDGNIHECQVIDPQDKLPESILDGIFDLFDRVNYELEVFGDKTYTNNIRSKWTKIECLEVPKDGYLVISNNAYSNDYVTFVNLVDIAIDVYFAKKGIKGLIDPEAKKKAIEMTVLEIVSEIGIDGFKSLFKSIFKNTVKEVTIDNIDIIINNLINLLDEFDVDFEKVLKKSIDTEFLLNFGEDVALFLLGGEKIKKVLQVAGYSNTALKLYDMGSSTLSSEICIYTPPAEEKVRISNGVTVTSETPLDPDYVLHTYVINQNDDLMTDAVPTIDPLADNYNMYDITLYKSSQAVQPNAKIKVMIPIPAGYDKSRIAVYWYKEDGTLEKMNATVNGSYAIFETDHLSYYVLVEEHVHTYGEDGEICTDCGFDRTEGCGCNCHKTGIAGFFWKIINFFNKIFKLKQECKCGIKHY